MKKLLVVLALTVVFATPAMADYSIQFTGLDIIYDGANITTAGAGGIDDLASVTTFVNGAPAGGYLNPPSTLLASIFIEGVGPLLAAGDSKTFTPTSPTRFDIAFESSYLFLDWDSPVTVTLEDTGDLFIHLSATTGDIFDTNLPIDTPVAVSFSTKVVNATVGGGVCSDLSLCAPDEYLTWAHAQGTGEVTGPLVPEPATLLLLGAGLAGSGVMRRRRKK